MYQMILISDCVVRHLKDSNVNEVFQSMTSVFGYMKEDFYLAHQ